MKLYMSSQLWQQVKHSNDKQQSKCKNQLQNTKYKKINKIW